MARNVVASPEAMMQSLFWPKEDLRDMSEFTIRKYSTNSVIRPKFLFIGETPGVNTSRPVDLPSALDDSTYIAAAIYYFNMKTRVAAGSQVLPTVLMLCSLPYSAVFMTYLNTGTLTWGAWRQFDSTILS